MTTLTHKDKLSLNRRARAHGLPDLWPEAEELVKRFGAGLGGPFPLSGLPGNWNLPAGWSSGMGFQGSAFFSADPPQPPPGASLGTQPGWPNPYDLKGGLTTPRKGFLHWLFG